MVSALSGGYYVRAVVRRQAAADQIKKTQSTQPYLKNLEIVLVEDLLKEGAFDDVVKGVDAVIHVASPLTKAVSGSSKFDNLQLLNFVNRPTITMEMSYSQLFR